MKNDRPSLPVNAPASDPPDESGSIRSRDDVVKGILQIYAEEAGSEATTNEYQLRRLIQALRNHKDRFGLLFAVCNDVPLRKELTRQIIAGLPEPRPVELQLDGTEDSFLDTLLDTPGAPGPLIVYGIELLLPSTESRVRQREKTLRELQLRREQFRKLARPLLLWMPEYVYTLIGQEAVDFWSWQSGGFFFTSGSAPNTQTPRNAGEKPTAVNFEPSHNLSNFNFIGREPEVEAALKALRENKKVVISGMEGVGKSVLSAYLASQLRDDYPDGQLRIQLLNTVSPVAGLKEAIWYFHPAETLPDDAGPLIAIYRQVLEGKRVLIILDDVADDTVVRPFLPPPGNAVLVTSRTALKLPDQVAISLDTLAPQDAIKALKRIVPDLTSNLAEEISKLCGYLPLAIQIVGGLLASLPKTDYEVYVERLREILKHLEPASNENRERSLEAALILSYEGLQPEAARVFRSLSAFSAAFDPEAEAAIGEDPDSSYLTELTRRLLLLHDETGNRYWVHPRMREFAAKQLPVVKRNQAALRHAHYYAKVLEQATRLYLEGGQSISDGLSLFDREWENIQAGQAWSAAHLAENREAAELCNDYVQIGWPIIDFRLQPREQIQWVEAALVAAQRLEQPDAEARHLGRLGIIYLNLGEVNRAAEFHQQALGIFQARHDRLGEGVALNWLGQTYEASGKYPEAIQAYERGLAIVREIGNRHQEARVLLSLGSVELELGALERGIKYLEQSLAIAREIGDRRFEGYALYNLGIAYYNNGQMQRTIEYCQQALAIFRQLGDTQGESHALGTLGQATVALGDLSEALTYYEESLSTARRIGDREGEGKALGNLGQLYMAKKDGRRAIEVSEQALAIFRQLNDRQSEGQVLGNIGLGHLLLGDFHRTIEYFEQALSVVRESHDRRREIAALGNLGSAYLSLGDAKRALEFDEQALKIAREIGDREREGRVLFSMSVAEDALGNRAQAIAYAQEALNIFEQTESPAAADVRQRLAQWAEQPETVQS